jgi:hypothetical protein
VGTQDPGAPLPDDRRPADFASNPGVIASTLFSGVIAVVVAAAEWTGSEKALASPTGILWSQVALLGVVAMLLGVALERRRRRQEPPPPARRPEPAVLPTGTVGFLFTDIEGSTRLLQELGDGYAARADQAGLADRGLAGDQHHRAATPAGPAQGLPQPAELGVTLEQGRRHAHD